MKPSTRPVEVVRVRSRRPVEPPSAPLPTTVLAALASIVRDMRDIPRDCIVDRAELLHWLRRMANRVEGVGRMRVLGVVPISPKRIIHQIGNGANALNPSSMPKTGGRFALPGSSNPIPRDLAEAVFGKGPTIVRAPGPRTILSRKGRVVRVEFRRAQANGQTELRF